MTPRNASSIKLSESEVAVLIENLRSDHWVYHSALHQLQLLEPALLAEHACDIATHLQDDDWRVRLAALQVLGKLEPGTLAKHASAIAQCLQDGSSDVRLAAVEVLGKLGPSTLSEHASVVAQLLQHRNWAIRLAAAQVLGKLEPATLAEHASAIGQHLQDKDWRVRKVAADVLSKLEFTIAQQLQDASRSVRKVAVQVLGKLDPAMSAVHLGSILQRLQDEDPSVREAASALHSRLERAMLANPMERICISTADTYLHTCAKHGCLELCCKLLEAGAAFSTANENGDTALHLAAGSGHVEVCHLLVKSGALLRVRNTQKFSPEDLARQAGCDSLAQWLAGMENVATICGGIGDALGAAMADTRSVSKVEWFTMAFPGIWGFAGIQHSLLAVTVGYGSKSHAYVLEKADSPVFNDGVYISHWRDVQPNVTDYPLHTLQGSNLENHTGKSVFTIGALRSVAAALGPYDVGSCNCHHAALKVYNACAKKSARVPEPLAPNEAWTLVANLLQKVGIDVAHSDIGPVHSGLFVSNPSTSHPQAPGDFFIESNCKNHDHRSAATCARLSEWIYEDRPDQGSLGKGVKLQHIELQQEGNPIQWAVVTDADKIFVTFKGTSTAVDVIRDLHVWTYDDAPHGLRVHSGMWTALHQRECHISNRVRDCVCKLHQMHNGLAKVVLCGHSLGGGYALITAMDLLHKAGGRCTGCCSNYFSVCGRRKTRPSPNFEIVIFGSPQVVVPDRSSAICRKLDSITTHYINAFDAVPRLPSCHEWLFEVIPQALSVAKSCGPSRSGVDLSEALHTNFQHEKAAMERYGTVGTLIFIQEGSRDAMRATASESQLRAEYLRKVPKHADVFLLEQHSMSKYASIIRNLQS